jgi:hypothetical protein
MVNERRTLFDDLSTKGAADGAGGESGASDAGKPS